MKSLYDALIEEGYSGKLSYQNELTDDEWAIFFFKHVIMKDLKECQIKLQFAKECLSRPYNMNTN